MHVADGIDLILRYRRLWTEDKMKREAPVAVSILGIIRNLQKVCQTNGWLFEDRAPFLAYKADCFFANTNCEVYEAPLDLGINGAPIDLVQLATIYQTGPGRLGYPNFDKAIPRVAGLHSTSEEYVNLLSYVDAADLVRRRGTSKYLMSPFEAGYKGGRRWRRAVQFWRDVYADDWEEIKSADSPASDPFHPDPVDHRFLPAESNVYQHHFDIPFFKYLTPIHDDFKAADRRKVSCRDQVLEAVIVDTGSSLVTAEAVRFPLQSSLADGQYVHQHLGRLQEEGSRTNMLEVIHRYALVPEVDDISAIIVVRRVSIADIPWWQVDT